MRALLAVLAIASSACLDSGLVKCGDQLCPRGSTCVQDQLCASGDQLAACAGIADGDACTVNGSVGHCELGVCVPSGCGNCVIDPGEVCDDCNQVGGDGCSADCKKIEVCGDGVVDTGEACDDGNANPADGCDACTLTTWRATPIIGGDSLATSIGLSAPWAVALDRQGNLYIAELLDSRIRRVDAVGVITTVAGDGTRGYSGDGGPAVNAQLNAVNGIAVDGLGNVYIADTVNQRVRVVDASGVITTIAGTGTRGYTSDNVPATGAELADPAGVAVDGLGNVFIADRGNNRVRRVDGMTGIITTVAGTGVTGFAGDGQLAINAQLDYPTAIALDASDDLYIDDMQNQRIRRVDAASGMIATIAGTGGGGSSGDGGPATAALLRSPEGIAVDTGGNVYIADTDNNRVRRIDASTGVIADLAGTGTAGFSGDGGAAAAALLWLPSSVVVGADGEVYITDYGNNRVRRVDATTTTIQTVAGNGSSGFGDGAATSLLLNAPVDLAFDSTGNMYVADAYGFRVRRIDAAGDITTVAGSGQVGDLGDGGPATSAEFMFPYGVAVDAAGNLYVADPGDERVRKIDTSGVITTLAGNSTTGYTGDGGPATSATLSSPYGVAVDAAGNVYIADTMNACVRRVDAASGTITTFAGTGTAGFSGDGVAATSAELSAPRRIAFDAGGSLYIADTGNQRVRRVDAMTCMISTVAGNGQQGYGGDGGAATSAQLNDPFRVALDAVGNLYIADAPNQRIRRVDAVTGVITTIAGTGAIGFSGDGGLGPSAQVAFAYGVGVDPAGRVCIADTQNGYVRRLEGGVITTIAGKIDPDGTGAFARAHLADPRALAVGPTQVFVASAGAGVVERARMDTGRLDVVAGRYPQATPTGNLARYRTSAFGDVHGVAYDAAAGQLYMTVSAENVVDVVTIVDPIDAATWTIATLAGDGTAGFSDGALATAELRGPTGLYLDAAAHVLYVADTGNHAIRAIDLAAKSVSTIAGTPATRGFYGDGGPATAALLYEPQAVTRCANGDLFIADTGNERVRRVSGGTITSVLGDGVAASSGEGSPATIFPVNAPLGLACDGFGNLFVTSTTTVRLVTADDHGVVDGTGAVETVYGAPPAAAFPASVTRCLTGLAVIDAMTLEVTDSCTGLLVQLVRGAK